MINSIESIKKLLYRNFTKNYFDIEPSAIMEGSIVITVYNAKHTLIGTFNTYIEKGFNENAIIRTVIDLINNTDDKFNDDFVIYDICETSENYILNNFYPCSITYKGNTYTNLQSAYEAQKESNPINRLPYTVCDGYTAIKMSKPSVKPNSKLMYKLLKIKFSNSKCKKYLLSTGNKEILFQNNWHDNYWGICTCDKCVGQGQNELGKLLMKVRDELNEEK